MEEGSTVIAKDWNNSKNHDNSFVAAVKEAIVEFAGMWRTVVCLLWLLNDREYVVQEHNRNPAKRRFVGPKSVPYLQVLKVGLNVPLKIVVRKKSGLPPEREYPRPLVQIPQHWAERRIHPECFSVLVDGIHEDKRVDDRTYQCLHCGRKRWLVKEHPRGDARVGFVEKIRVMKTKKD